MRVKKWLILIIVLIFFIVVGYFTMTFMEPEYAYIPPKEKVISKENRLNVGVIDIWGEMVSKEEAEEQLKSNKGRAHLSAENGAVKIDNKLLNLGRETFYKETFGNEVFLTDVIGVVNGPISVGNMAKAIVALKGKGTTNLQVELEETVKIGDKTFKKGDKIDTGIDVPKGAFAPLGMPVKYSEGKIKVGISCAACHATVHPKTLEVMEGVTNPDLNTGLVLALATNSAAYFPHSEIESIKNYLKDLNRTVVTTNGKREALPDPKKLEDAVDQVFVKWPRGNFDSSIDMKSNPTQIPDAFTLGDHPYSWSGAAMAGPFKGLTVFSNNVHAQNSDALAQAPVSQALFGIDPEVYIGTILQNATDKKYRYDPKKGEKPSEFFTNIDPTPGVPGINQMVKPPSFPKITLVAPDGLHVSSPDYKVNEQNNAVAGWQNTLEPPTPRKKTNKKMVSDGRRVFAKAGCITCHAGNYLTNNKVISVKEIGTEPTRAGAFKKTEKIFGESRSIH